MAAEEFLDYHITMSCHTCCRQAEAVRHCVGAGRGILVGCIKCRINYILALPDRHEDYYVQHDSTLLSITLQLLF